MMFGITLMIIGSCFAIVSISISMYIITKKWMETENTKL